MRQVAPDPTILSELLAELHYRPGWTFALRDIDRGQGSEGLTLIRALAPGCHSLPNPA